MAKPYEIPYPVAEKVAEVAAANDEPMSNICVVCFEVITIQIMKNSNACCENHRKERDGDTAPARLTGG